MKYLKRFDEASIPDEYITSSVIREIRDIEVPEGFSIKLPTKDNTDLYRISKVSSFTLRIYKIDRTKHGKWFEYGEVKKYLNSVIDLVKGRYDVNICTFYPKKGYHSIDRPFNKLELDSKESICAFELNFHCLFKDFKNNVGATKINSGDNKYETIDKGDWEDIFTDIICDYKYSVTCRYSKGAYQFTISKTYNYNEEPKEIDDSLKHHIDDIIHRLEAIYDLQFEFISFNSSPVKRLSPDEWENCNLVELLDSKQVVIRLFYSNK